jgi:xanthine dehydrogenase FAD-binding subunit
MDLGTVTSYRRPSSRADLVLAPGEIALGGGTWLFSEPQLAATGLVDLTSLGWTPLERTEAGLRIGATCSIATLARMPDPGGWTAQPLFRQCATALLASFKIWNVATVGGNVCTSLAAGAMISLLAGLDAEAELWRSDGSTYRLPVAAIPTGNNENVLAPGDVLRALDVPEASLASRTGYRKIALSPLGRSGAVLVGRRDGAGCVFTITAATLFPVQLRYDRMPDAATLRRDVFAVDGYFDDAHGRADWRREMSAVLLDEIREELA